MLDGKWDKDAVDKPAEVTAIALAEHHLEAVAAPSSEDAIKFRAGSPSSVGFDKGDLKRVGDA
jgi:hypothetical protein